MPAPEFATIVDTLAGVRQDYHEKLKSIPQYEALLLIQSSTEKAAGVLHGTEAGSIATDVIDSLQYARNRFEQHMTSIPEYRVLVALDRLIREVSQHLGLASHDEAPAEEPAVAASPEAASPEPAAEAVAAAEMAETEAPAEEAAPAEAEPDVVAQEEAEEEAAATETAEAEAPTLRVVDAPVASPSIVPASHDADAVHEDDIVVLNAPAWEKSGKDAKDDITARLAAQAAAAAAHEGEDDHDVADADLVVVSKREPSDHEAA
ncbi:hypothetical protein ACQR1Y_12650 [Bradyrhizobium sp. HKCCYLRH3099]|uniref:hypothetical protein n=1 Tax=unclassified Bradyrhizobium TaxID=2631580 RepID=UPI003EBF6911